MDVINEGHPFSKPSVRKYGDMPVFTVPAGGTAAANRNQNASVSNTISFASGKTIKVNPDRTKSTWIWLAWNHCPKIPPNARPKTENLACLAVLRVDESAVAILMRAPIHDTTRTFDRTTRNEVISLDPMGYHVTASFMNANMEQENKHLTVHGYCVGPTPRGYDYTLTKATAGKNNNDNDWVSPTNYANQRMTLAWNATTKWTKVHVTYNTTEWQAVPVEYV